MLFSKPKSYEFLLVCLGNPGEEYEITRHNSGFLFSEWAEDEKKLKIKRIKFKAVYGDISLSGHKGLILRPQTYMNASGEAVAAFASAYNIPPEKVIVTVDDINLPVGGLRVRRRGSAGGHNGLKSIIECLKTEDFPRIRIGVGQKAYPGQDLADYVLSRFSKDELKLLPEVFSHVYGAAELIADGKIDTAMQKYN